MNDRTAVQVQTEPVVASPTEAAPGKAWERPLEIVLGVLACVSILLFLITSVCRLRYPFPLEQLEGSMLLAAMRVAHGLPVYAQPNFHFIPYMYAPAYYYVSGWAVRLLGSTFFPLRLISLLSTCGSFAAIYTLVLLETKGAGQDRTGGRRHLAALTAAGLYAVAYPWTQNWFDLGRLDSFYVLLFLLALLTTRRLHPVLAAVVWTLTFLAKQTILPVALIMLCYDWKRPRRVLLGVASFFLMAAISVRWLNHATHGWFRFYAFTVPHANADLLLRPMVFFLPSEMIAPFGAALLVIGIAWVVARPKIGSPATRFYLLAGGSTLALCWFLQAHGGATGNTPMPMYAVLAAIFGISFGWVYLRFAPEKNWRWARILVLVLAAIPLVSWVYYPHDRIPQRDLLESHAELTRWVRSFPGDVFLPSNPYEAVAAGKEWHPDIAALHDALRPDIPAIRQPLVETIRAEIDGEKFDAIALDGPPAQALASQTWLPADLQKHYPITGIVPGSEVFDPFAPHPVYFLLPCREQALAVAKGWTLLQPGDQAPCSR